MTTTLVIDRGNTTLKAGIFRGEECVCHDRIELTDDIASRLTALTEKHSPRAAIYSSVVPGAKAPEGLLERLTGRRPLVLSHSTPLPLKVVYRTPQTLGLDRIAAAAGALLMAKEGPRGAGFMLVVDAGTAVTIDLVDTAKASFLGGNISAGLSMRLRALHEYTGALPDISPRGEVLPFGADTAGALRSGAVNGITAEIEKAFADATELCGVSGRLVITGGDAGIIAPRLRRDLPYSLCPTLVAQGLNSILHYNETYSD